MNHEQLAEELLSIGWTCPNDAQWSRLKTWLEALGEFPRFEVRPTCEADLKAVDIVNAVETGFRQLDRNVKIAREELQVVKSTIISIIGGFDYEGFPITELNYLQRLRIMIENENKLDIAVSALTYIGHQFTGQSAIREKVIETLKLIGRMPACYGCKQPIDPETCWCGSPIKGHSMTDNHGPIEMGCICHTQDFQPEEDDSVPM